MYIDAGPWIVSISRFFSKSHTLTAVPDSPDAKVFPSGPHATEQTV
jgi:hypothetical protein